MPSVSGRFQTLKRERLFQNPPKDKSAFPALQEAILPHTESFNALTVDGGLLDLAVKDIGERAVFDGNTEVGPFGNKLTSTALVKSQDYSHTQLTMTASPCGEDIHRQASAPTVPW